MIIITVCLVQIWRAKLFKNVRGMRANRCSMILHVALLTSMIIAKCMDIFLTCSFYSDFFYHLACFSLTMLICYVLLMTNRPPKSLKSTPIQITDVEVASLDFSMELRPDSSSFTTSDTKQMSRTKSDGEIIDKAFYLRKFDEFYEEVE